MFHKLSGSLDFAITPKPSLNFPELLHLWRSDPVAIGDISLQGH
jgi:hypothetical protein